MAKRTRKTNKLAGNGPTARVPHPSGVGDGHVLGDYRHLGAKRKNNPPAKIAAEGTVPVIPKAQYAYNPHLPPVLRFDPKPRSDEATKPRREGESVPADELPPLIAEAGRRPLTPEEQMLLAEALRNHEPWLEWTGKRERQGFEVDPVALHIHERVSAQAILKIAARQDVQRDLFADPEQEYHEAVQFYKHDIDWSNRLVLGDSLQVMSSLARREDLAGKVQMIYMDPPYGIKFASNFQPEVGRRDVKDKEQDLTREPEMVRAYRDTWHLGIHSYLTYLRDRLIVARELLADTGSIFVQISDENFHRVRNLLDEVFGKHNFVCSINYKTSVGLDSTFLDRVTDHLLWFARSIDRVKYRQLYKTLERGEEGATRYNYVELSDGTTKAVGEFEDENTIPIGCRFFTDQGMTSRSGTEPERFDVSFEGGTFRPSVGKWRTNQMGMARVVGTDRVMRAGSTIRFRKFFDDFGAIALTNFWSDVGGGIASRADPKVYVVQTSARIVARCMLMTTDPGDLVLDPTCGSGTTAYVAEQWGRRWITTDTSRVAIAIARQRLLTAKYDFYKLRPLTAEDTTRNPGGTWLHEPNGAAREPRTFQCKSVPHITLKSIAQNVALDPIFARHEPILEKALAACNSALAKVTPECRAKLSAKLIRKEREQGKRAVTDADRRRWDLPGRGVTASSQQGTKGKPSLNPQSEIRNPQFEHWTVPFDTDPDWPTELQDAVTAYRAVWRAKMDEVNACIAASAEHEELVDQPEKVSGIVRVSGPFTVEAVQPPEMSLSDNIDVHTSDQGLFDGEPSELPEGFEARSLRIVEPRNELEVANVTAYLDQMIRFLKADGVRFPNNKQLRWTRLDPLFESGSGRGFHAEGRWVPVNPLPSGEGAGGGAVDPEPDGPNNVGVVVGPQYGPVTAKMIEELIRPAGRLYDHLVVAAFSFTAEAQAILGEDPHPKLKIHFAHIRPDINPGMNGLLKESPQPGAGQLFTVFGLPRVRVEQCGTAFQAVGSHGQDARATEYTVTMEGVDIYNPVDHSIASTGASKVAAWFLDGDYDGRTFCITQAFFPDKSAWDKLARALNGKDGPIDAERFEAFSGTTSLPFPPGKHRCVAVKVIDPRGNEVMSVHKLE